MSLRLRRHWRRQAARESELIVPSPHLWLPGREWPERSPFARGLADSPYIGNPTCCCPEPGGPPCSLFSDCFSITCSTLPEIVITITGAADDLCANCTDFNAAFTASHVVFCLWGHTVSPIACDPRLGSAPANSISASITCVGEQCRILGQINMIEDPVPSDGAWREIHQFNKVLPSGQVFQNGSNHNLSFGASICQVFDGDLASWFQTCAAEDEYECDFSSATFNVDFNAP